MEKKRANVVLNSSFKQGVIAVDVHVHRIVNMWDFIKTKNEIESSKVLNEIVPKDYSYKLNNILVAFGQTICTPQNPKCDVCPVANSCQATRF